MKEEDLSEDAVALLKAGKNAKMSDESRERLRSAVFAKIAVGGGSGGGAAAAGKAGVAGAKSTVAVNAAGWSTMAKTVFVASAIALTGGGIYIATMTSPSENSDTNERDAMSRRDNDPATEQHAPQEPAQEGSVEAPAIEQAPAIEHAPAAELAPNIPRLPHRPRQTAGVPAPPQQLEAPANVQTPTQEIPLAERVDEEARLIRNAIARNREGHYEDALRFLRTHALLHPSGTLADERTAAQVEALCGLHRNDEAERLRASFLAAHPNSPLRARMTAACGTP